MKDKLDKQELAIIEYIENQQPSSIAKLEARKSEIYTAIKAKVSKKQPLSIRLLQDDLRKIKTQALRDGIGYQTLISSIIHQYANGTLMHK
jgi:predicted DNA binding CopG/RHH family protein